MEQQSCFALLFFAFSFWVQKNFDVGSFFLRFCIWGWPNRGVSDRQIMCEKKENWKNGNVICELQPGRTKYLMRRRKALSR